MSKFNQAICQLVKTAITLVDIFVAKLGLKKTFAVVPATGVSLRDDDESTCCGGGCGCTDSCGS